MQALSVKAAYRRYAGLYDALFGPVLQPGRRALVDVLGLRPGERVLEAGVGTGLSLPLYPRDVRVTGIDLSREMLDKARRRVARQRLGQVEALLEMDAEDMSFADASFDRVAAMYVVSVSPRPERLLAELTRVCRPGGEIFIVNHVRSHNRVVAAMEKGLARFSSGLGFRPDFELRQMVNGAHVVDELATVNYFWKVLRLRSAAAAQPRPA